MRAQPSYRVIYCAGSFASLGLLKPFTKQYFHICHRERWLKKLQNLAHLIYSK